MIHSSRKLISGCFLLGHFHPILFQCSYFSSAESQIENLQREKVLLILNLKMIRMQICQIQIYFPFRNINVNPVCFTIELSNVPIAKGFYISTFYLIKCWLQQNKKTLIFHEHLQFIERRKKNGNQERYCIYFNDCCHNIYLFLLSVFHLHSSLCFHIFSR